MSGEKRIVRMPRAARLALALMVLLGLAACAPVASINDSFRAAKPGASPDQLLEQARAWQVNRDRELPEYWILKGVLDIDHPENGRRNSVMLHGHSSERLRMIVYGPFRQVALEVWLGDQWVDRVDAGNATVTSVPADAFGLAYLTGLELHPRVLINILLGVVDLRDPVQVQQQPGGLFLKTAAGEMLLVTPETGRPLRRQGEARPGMQYHAYYEWGSERGILPERIVVKLGEKTTLTLIPKSWNPHADDLPADWRAAYGKKAKFNHVMPLRRR
ncbi:hypothetical protein [Magnetofaba australis]|uniref:Outer-membrane lipoprotein LolB n=1 Tax=Magnetofaba australis IT-1 TaxID=1434232 RepID=A0A1Y2K736_9PROT|nr:hypothetical protein [Magnetofaba australis]OSM04251.1 hypothetical protein MAIT1_04119 [Magnetofaba australis IT-1]